MRYLKTENLSQGTVIIYCICTNFQGTADRQFSAVLFSRISIIASHSVFLQSIEPIVIITIFKDDYQATTKSAKFTSFEN